MGEIRVRLQRRARTLTVDVVVVGVPRLLTSRNIAKVVRGAMRAELRRALRKGVDAIGSR